VIRRALLTLFILAVVWFAVEGGEFGSWDLWKQRQQKIALQRSLDSLAQQNDSLKKYRARLNSDPALQEKLARENVGMVRGEKELVYRLTPDSAKRPH
jgi:cell division protein FtsB